MAGMGDACMPMLEGQRKADVVATSAFALLWYCCAALRVLLLCSVMCAVRDSPYSDIFLRKSSQEMFSSFRVTTFFASATTLFSTANSMTLLSWFSFFSISFAPCS